MLVRHQSGFSRVNRLLKSGKCKWWWHRQPCNFDYLLFRKICFRYVNVDTQVLVLCCFGLRRFATSFHVTVVRCLVSIRFLHEVDHVEHWSKFAYITGVGRSKIALIRSSPTRVPSANKTCQRYIASYGPNCTLSGLTASSDVWRALNELPNLPNKRCIDHLHLQITGLSEICYPER